ncbi:pathogenesis-related thaumatin-like protein 3.5 [Curcuma longa]|uniref:pathogenesis-related thaumatin-like protein 3.5 n=1 Tax=Curcuma longa TaxID=136217 RepID=UPI003D9F07CE
MESLFFFVAVVVVLFWGPAPAIAATAFTFHNKCRYTVWPATLSGNTALGLGGGGGFELRPNATASFSAPPSWSGRFWARTGCSFDPTGTAPGRCDTGDCGGALLCSVGGAPPATLAEFTLAGPSTGDKDFYDVSLVDGYNVGIGVRPEGRRGGNRCQYTGCVADVNKRCPAELRVAGPAGHTVACRSACEVFGASEYCCTGAHGSPETCRPSRYSRVFKSACPAAYSYAYDDATSTFTCASGTQGYRITFCPTAGDRI